MAQEAIRTSAPDDPKTRRLLGRWNREDHIRPRDYSQTLGRFVERDPIGFEAGDNNWYRFVGNGPAGETDPTGLTDSELTEGTEANDLAILQQDSLEPWRANGWSIAVALLEHFLDKTKDKTKPFDLSGRPDVKNITESPTVTGILREVLRARALDNNGVIHFDNQLVASPKWLESSGEVLRAFGGFRLHLTGSLRITENDPAPGLKSWSFKGTARIEDNYTFKPDDWFRMQWISYRAARDLQENQVGYKPFDVVLNWEYAASGCIIVNHTD